MGDLAGTNSASLDKNGLSSSWGKGKSKALLGERLVLDVQIQVRLTLKYELVHWVHTYMLERQLLRVHPRLQSNN